MHARDFETALAEGARAVESALDRLLPQAQGPEAKLYEAMRYAALGGGKRLRGFLVLQSGALCDANRAALECAAASVECVHAYSLVHDDLPAMDDDDLRRGKPTVHKAYDEATAILVGDALLTLAFGLISSPKIESRACRDLVARLAQAAGSSGMVGGQMLDIALEGRPATAPEMTRVQRQKTAALLSYACEAGAILGKAPPDQRKALAAYGEDLGLAFQIADDLLDAEGDAGQMGKAARKDAARGKPTSVSVLGKDGARSQAEALAAQAVRHLDLFGEKADLLRAAAGFVVARRA
jgi:farnesyl diphosphate synthase